MVNRGRPSLDCFPCRKRKLRCGLQKKGCSQCQRAGLECHGYRDPTALDIRDETNSTKKKAQARVNWISNDAVTSVTIPTTIPNTCYSQQLAWSVRARHAFFTTYLFGLSSGYDVLAPLYQQASSSGHLVATVDAVSLAFFAVRHDVADLSQLANETYVVAIQRLGRALVSPCESLTDETLQSVLLLDIYEKMVNRNPKRSNSWMSHIRGAMSLINARGERNYTSSTSRQLTSRMVLTGLLSCAVSRARVPDILCALHRNLRPHTYQSKYNLTALVIEVVNLQADIHSGELKSSSEIIKKTTALDGEFLNIEETLPSYWITQRISCPENQNPLIYGSYYDVYSFPYVTQIRNTVRTMRLFLNNILLHYFHSDINDHSKLSTKATNMLKEMAITNIRNITHEVCASVPQFILPRPSSAASPTYYSSSTTTSNWLHLLEPGADRGDAFSSTHSPSFSQSQTLQCYTILCPLYLAARLSSSLSRLSSSPTSTSSLRSSSSLPSPASSPWSSASSSASSTSYSSYSLSSPAQTNTVHCTGFTNTTVTNENIVNGNDKIENVRDYALHVLNYIAETGTLKTAKDVADLLCMNEKRSDDERIGRTNKPESEDRCEIHMEYWNVYSSVGSYAFAA